MQTPAPLRGIKFHKADLYFIPVCDGCSESPKFYQCDGCNKVLEPGVDKQIMCIFHMNVRKHLCSDDCIQEFVRQHQAPTTQRNKNP